MLSLRDPRRPPQGLRDPALQPLYLSRWKLQKEGCEDEHEDENANGTGQESSKHVPQGAPGGSKMSAWSPPGRFWAPCGPKVGVRSAPK